MAVWNFRGDKGQLYLKITSSTNVATLIPAYEREYADVYMLVIANTSGSNCNVTIRDSEDTNAKKFVFAVPANDTRGFALPKASAHQQTSINKPWTAQCSASVDSIEITALFTKSS